MLTALRPIVSIMNCKILNTPPSFTSPLHAILPILDAQIYLRPKERFSLGFDFDVSHSNIQDIGITLGSSVISRNVFRGAEILEVGVKGTVGASSDVAEQKNTFLIFLNWEEIFKFVSLGF